MITFWFIYTWKASSDGARSDTVDALVASPSSCYPRARELQHEGEYSGDVRLCCWLGPLFHCRWMFVRPRRSNAASSWRGKRLLSTCWNKGSTDVALPGAGAAGGWLSRISPPSSPSSSWPASSILKLNHKLTDQSAGFHQPNPKASPPALWVTLLADERVFRATIEVRPFRIRPGRYA